MNALLKYKSLMTQLGLKTLPQVISMNSTKFLFARLKLYP